MTDSLTLDAAEHEVAGRPSILTQAELRERARTATAQVIDILIAPR